RLCGGGGGVWEGGRSRHYLGLLARVGLDAAYRGKIDLSGVVQQTLLKAHQAQGRFQAQGEAQRAAWLRRILANTLADEVRKLHTHKPDLAPDRSLEAALEESAPPLEARADARQTPPTP